MNDIKAKIQDHKIMTMEHDKRERVINAALKEFCKGYKHASTDVIVKEAGISKGLLYHYFGTKKGLLGFLCEYAMELMVSEFIDKVDFEERDFFERLWNLMLVKMDLSYKYPAIFDFLGVVYLSEESEFKELNLEIQQVRAQHWQLGDDWLFKGIDTSLFKEGSDVQKAIDIVRWTFTGYSEQLLRKYPTTKEYQSQYDDILEDVRGYMKFFRQTFYC